MEATLLLLTALLLAPLAVLHADDDSKKKPDEALMLCDLKCEYRINPVGIDVANPRLSWKIESVERGVIQSAQELRTALSKEDLAAGKQPLWETRKLDQDKSVHVPYKGPKLESRDGKPLAVVEDNPLEFSKILKLVGTRGTPPVVVELAPAASAPSAVGNIRQSLENLAKAGLLWRPDPAMRDAPHP